jgi:hypothetical protein
MILENSKYDYPRLRRILLTLSITGLICSVVIFLSAALRETIIVLAEKFIVHRQLTHVIWSSRLVNIALGGIILSLCLFIVGVIPNLLRLSVLGRTKLLSALNIKKLPIEIKLLSLLGIFLLLYVRYNINIMTVLLILCAWKTGFFLWISKTFGEKEAKTALFTAVIAAVFFIVIMLYFRVALVMDYFGESDQNRVFRDFTEVSANHYRVKVHPFYVIMWQTLYHLVCPLETSGSLAIRVMVAVFTGLNIGLFSLFVSRIVKGRVLNIILCSIMVFSFPQIYHGAQILESFIFTQTSLLVTILYFSFALENKTYNLRALLALALFMTGNNIAYLCVFALFYLFLLSGTSTLKQAFVKSIVFSTLFMGIFSVLLLLQSLFYGSSAPTNILSMITEIISEEGYYIARSVNLLKYTVNFFNTALFEYLPFGIGYVFTFGWLWVLLLILPFMFLKHIKNKKTFFAIATNGMFLFVFHSFYGASELALYGPVISAAFLCLFVYAVQVLPKKIAVGIGGVLLGLLILVNSFGTYNVYRLNKFVFGQLDIVDKDEHQENIDAIEDLYSAYSGNKLFFYKALDK